MTDSVSVLIRYHHCVYCTRPHDQGTYYSLIVRLDVSDVDDVIKLTPLDTYSTVIINRCDCVWAFVLRTAILVLVVFLTDSKRDWKWDWNRPAI